VWRSPPSNRIRIPLALLMLVSCAIALAGYASPSRSVRGDEPARAPEPNRSPVALALSSDGSRLLVANQTSGTVSLVDPRAGTVLSEVATGEKPAGVAISKDGRRGVVSHWYGYNLAVLDVGSNRIEVVGRVEVGPEPRGVAISPDGRTAYVAVGVSNEVVRVDLDARQVTGRLPVGREPRGLAISPDGSRLLVGNARGQSLSVIGTADFQVEHTLTVDADNLRQVAISADGQFGYVANMKNRGFATTQQNIDRGWVLGQRLSRIPLDGSESYASLSLDPQGKAVADAYGVASSRDGRFLAVSCGGTHEVVLFRTDAKPLPWRSGGSRDLIHEDLLKGDGRFRRVAVGGRPTELAFAPDGNTLYAANYLENAVQVVDAEAGTLVKSIALGGPSELTLARQGEILFHDATRSFNQWYSCNTCHADGHTGGLDFDTMNDGWHDLSTAHLRSRKKVPTLRGVVRTKPWTWHGWQTSLEDAIVESFTKSMQGSKPKPEDLQAMVAYLGTLEYPRNPYREPDGSLSPAAQRGESVFRSAKAACNTCHGGPELTDGKIHVVGLEERGDVYRGYNPPTLRGLYDKEPYLHDGRAATLRDVLTGPHNPENVTGLGSLSEAETDDLIAYLKSL
jgi:YVTN family beta-propeller protein